MRAVITGGSGFLGTNLVSHFLEQGWEVVNYDIAPPRNPEHVAIWRYIDIHNRDELLSATQAFQPSVFLHFAARTDLDEHINLAGYATNIEGVCNVVEAVRATPSVDRVIIASSQLVCRLGYVPKCDYDYCPSTLYGLSKVLTERIIRAADDIGAIWTIVRPTSLWGPWFDTPYRGFFDVIARGVYFHPAEVRSLKQWGFVSNSVYQISKLLEAPAKLVHKKTLYLADYEPVDIREFAGKVQTALGAKPIRTVPRTLLRAIAVVGDLLRKLGWANPPLTSFRYDNIITSEIQDLQPLREIVGELPFTLTQGIERTIEWLRVQQ